MTELNLPGEMKHQFEEPSYMEHSSLHIACESQAEAVAVLDELTERAPSDEVFHTEVYPVTNDEDGSVEYYAVLIRRLEYSHEVGWVSADVNTTPDFDLSIHDGDQLALKNYYPENVDYGLDTDDEQQELGEEGA